MTKHKLNLRNVAAIVACLAVTLNFASCKKVAPRSTFFGIWSEEWSITFSANDIRVDQSDGGWYKVSPIIWTAVTNTNSETKDDYPSGYKITGLVSEGDSEWFIGESWGEDWAYFIHKDGNSIIEQGNNNGWYYVLTKNISKSKGVIRANGLSEQMYGSNKKR